ncbi:hypothetical protein BDB01DRAFT_781237 [Pilobolus umbonatus]|nr:hypothetical protein BDB01DRAFT_781237 [Pilobolus umbonatus]
MTANSPTHITQHKNGYAYEIRFMDNDIVQVFDLARKHQDPSAAILPAEYKQEDVLQGRLRYSGLLGSPLKETEEDTPYEHIVTTKRAGRASIQRHTFFMMGGGESNVSRINRPDSTYSVNEIEEDVAVTHHTSPKEEITTDSTSSSHSTIYNEDAGKETIPNSPHQLNYYPMEDIISQPKPIHQQHTKYPNQLDPPQPYKYPTTVDPPETKSYPSSQTTVRRYYTDEYTHMSINDFQEQLDNHHKGNMHRKNRKGCCIIS